MPEKTIVDASVPNAGRIYDYLLGGHHNFEIDRRAGDRLESLIPFLPKLMRLMRWCLADVGHYLTYDLGYDAIVDFASGLPTADHLHTTVAPGTTVIYSDRDPVCVEYGCEILGSTPDVHYFQADCRWPEKLLNRPDIQDLLKGKQRIAYVYWGISMYLTDEEIQYITKTLYDLSAPDSCLTFYLQPANPDTPEMQETMEIYRQMGEQLHFRPLERFQTLFEPWIPNDLGYRTVDTEWHGVDSQLSDTDLAVLPGTTAWGVYLVKPEWRGNGK